MVLAAGWFSLLYYNNNLDIHQIQVWNPFQVLGVSSRSSLSHIKRSYKMKCISNHPDKRKNVSKARAEVDFIEITKAYKVYLTPPPDKAFSEYI